ncbi:tight adherence protein C [Nitrosomonas nitrosa]|uniref:Tight adherence protein C n=1 Tax=Nitrosomonas nitrosa TaxID=52442 RepID=A0A1I4UU75_9PROT|nr:hypothetical protein [Nitrosomonas nitrosa]SFM92524.1 tight adherence protein C [Nitrosomonas nitrosa]
MMISEQTIFLVIVFLAVAGIAYAIMLIVSPGATQVRLKQIARKGNTLDKDKEADVWKETVVKLSEPLAKLSLPEEDWNKSAFRARFMHAGFRSSAAPTIYGSSGKFVGNAITNR